MKIQEVKLIAKIENEAKRIAFSLKSRLSYGGKIKKVLKKILFIRSSNFKKVFINKWKTNSLIKKVRIHWSLLHIVYIQKKGRCLLISKFILTRWHLSPRTLCSCGNIKKAFIRHWLYIFCPFIYEGSVRFISHPRTP